MGWAGCGSLLLQSGTWGAEAEGSRASWVSTWPCPQLLVEGPSLLWLLRLPGDTPAWPQSTSQEG